MTAVLVLLVTLAAVAMFRGGIKGRGRLLGLSGLVLVSLAGCIDADPGTSATPEPLAPSFSARAAAGAPSSSTKASASKASSSATSTRSATPSATPTRAETTSAAPATTQAAPAAPENTKSVYFGSCKAAREAGASPLHRGDPGYRAGLDRDGDGVACE